MINLRNKLIITTLGISSIIASSKLSDIGQINTSSNNYNYDYQEKVIPSPVGKSFLTTAGDWENIRREWAHTTINLGQMKQEQIMGIGSKYDDSYTEHKVVKYGEYYFNKNAGIHHGPNFRDCFFKDEVTPNWNYNTAVSGAYQNFYNKFQNGSAWHSATGTIKFLWHYNDKSDLLIDIVGTLEVGAWGSLVEGIASIKLGELFVIYYK